MPSCRNCLLPDAVPNIVLDTSHVCNLCQAHQVSDCSQSELIRSTREGDLEYALKNSKGKGSHDALVCLSGGKDSIYLLYKLKTEYKLNILAFTTDMNVPPVAWENIKRTVAKLDVEHLVFRPEQQFYRKFYRWLLQHQEERGAVRTVCYVCAPLFEGYALKAATERGIPLVLAAYSPGQPDPERMVYEFPESRICHTDWTPKELRDCGLFSASELAHFWNPFQYPEGTKFPRYLAPFHAWEYNQAKIIKLVVELGLVKDARSASPIESNCHLNWLLMYSDLKNLGYNPYMPEFSALIREGKASRLYWKVLMPLMNLMIKYKVGLGKHVTTHLKWLDLRPEDLVIRRPKKVEWDCDNNKVESIIPGNCE
jgi:hypothetical protein